MKRIALIVLSIAVLANSAFAADLDSYREVADSRDSGAVPSVSELPESLQFVTLLAYYLGRGSIGSALDLAKVMKMAETEPARQVD